MNYSVPADAKPLKCPSCGAPVAPKPDEIAVKCEYWGNGVIVGTPSSPSPPPTTIIVETRRRHMHPRRLRRLLESAGFASREEESSTEGIDSER